MKHGTAGYIVFSVSLPVAPVLRAGESIEIGVDQVRLVPETLTANAGTTAKRVKREWRHNRSVRFPAEALESAWLVPGGSWSRRFDRPGRIRK